MFRRSLAIAVISLGATLALPQASQAYPAETTGDLNVRAGPGVGHARIGVLPRHSVVNVRFCQSRWCQIDYRGGIAWASGSYLRGVRVAVPGRGPYYGRRHYRRPFYGAPVYGRRHYGRRYYGRSYYRQPGVSIYFGTGFGPWIGF
jgi:uncharacterized protein YraI